jgi:hypothetical protein
MTRMTLCLLIGGTLSLPAAPAAASCRISNQTKYAFTVDSGNVASQRIGANAITTVAAGKIQGKSPEGKTISGSCKDGGDLVILEKNGVPLLQSRGAQGKSPKRR